MLIRYNNVRIQKTKHMFKYIFVIIFLIAWHKQLQLLISSEKISRLLHRAFIKNKKIVLSFYE